MYNLIKSKHVSKIGFIKFLFFILLCENLVAQNKVGLCFPTASSGTETTLSNLSVSIPNPISGANAYSISSTSNPTGTTINSGTVSVGAGNITITNSYLLKSTADVFSEAHVTYTLTSTSGTPGTTTVDLILIPQPLIKTIPLGIIVDVCSNKIFSLPLDIQNKIGSTYGYIWTVSSSFAPNPAVNQTIPVVASSGTQNLVGSGTITYAISATIDTIKTGSPYKGYSFPNFNICKTTTNGYTIRLHSSPQKPNIGPDTTICISSTNDKINLKNLASSSLLVDGWYQLSGKTRLSLTPAANSTTTQVSGFQGADKSKGPLADEYEIVCYETNAGCDTLRDTIVISVWQKPVAAITTPNPSYFCNADKNSSTVALKTASPNSTGEWTVSGTPTLPTIADNTLNNTTTTNSTITRASETYTYTWKVDNSHCDASTPTLSNNISIIATHSPSPATLVSPSSNKVCDNVGTIDLIANVPTFGIGTWSFLKTLPGSNSTTAPSFDTIGVNNNSIKVNIPIVTKDSNAYVFMWKVENVFCADFSVTYDTIYVYPKDEANILSPDTTWLCSNAITPVTLNATSLKSAKGLWTLISKPLTAPNPSITTTTNPTISVSNLASPVANKPDTNMYVFTWSIKGTNVNSGLCGIVKTLDTVRIAIVNQPSLAEIKDGTPDTVYVCNNSPAPASFSIKATAPIVGKGNWTWTSLNPGGVGSVNIISSSNNPILTATATVPTNNTDIYKYKLTWRVSNGATCGSTEKSILIYTQNSVPGTSGITYIQEECAIKDPQSVLLQSGIAGISGSDVLWTQLPPPLSDVALTGFPSTKPNFTIQVSPPQGSAVGKYLFTIGNNSSKCSKRDTVKLLINNPPTSPTLTPGSKYNDTNYVCHIGGKPDTLYGLSMRNDPASTIGKGRWSQNYINSSNPIKLFNILTNSPDTMGSINLIINDNNVNTGSTSATYDLTWTVTSGACIPTSKTIVFVVSNNQVTGIAKIKNKPSDGIRWLCSNGSTRDTVLEVIGGYTGTGTWTQITTPPYNNTIVNFIKSPSDPNSFSLRGLPFVNNKPDTMRFAFVWNITLAGSKCIQTSADTIKFYIVSPPPNIPNIADIPICGNPGSTVSTVIIAPTPIFGQGYWTTTTSGIAVTNQPPVSAIVDNIPSPSITTVRWNLQNAQCPIINTKDLNIKVTDGVKAQVKERVKYVCTDGFIPTISNNKITKAVALLNVAAETIRVGSTGKWTIAPSSDGILIIPTGTENNPIISPTLTIQGNSLAKDSTIYKLYWTTNSSECGTTVDSTIIIAYPPLSDSITGGYTTCLVGSTKAALSTTLFGPYISGKSGKWAQDTVKTTIISNGTIYYNDNAVVITNTPTAKSDSVKVSNLIVPTDTNINGYGIRRIVPATDKCPERSKIDTIRVYQQASTAQIIGLDTIFLCTLRDTTITIVANQPIVGQGFWRFVSKSNSTSSIPSIPAPNDSILNCTIPAGDSCIYRFRWTTYRSTECGNINGSTKDVYIVGASGSSSGTNPAQITQIDGKIKLDTNWLCQVTSTQLTNNTYSIGKGTWRVISGHNPLGVTFTPVSGATKTKVNVSNLSLPTNNDTSKYVIEFSIANGICATTRDIITIFILRNPSKAQLSGIPASPQFLCDITTLPNPPHDSTVVIPSVGVGIWTGQETFPGRAPNLGIDTIKWTWKVSNRCGTDSIKRIYIIANNAQGNAKIKNKPFSPNIDTLIICLPVNKDTILPFNGNSPAPGFGKWSNFLNSLTFKTNISDSTVQVAGLSGDDSVRIYGLTWGVFKAGFCPASYDTAYVKAFRKPEKPIFKPDTTMCVRPDVPTGSDSVVFSVAPTNNYKFGKFEWTIVRGGSSTPAGSPYIYIIPPTQSQKTARVVLKNTNNLTDSFTYILRLKVGGGGSCGGDSTDYKITVYPRIINKDAFGYNSSIYQPDPGSKIIRVCSEPFDQQTVYLANKTLKPYQTGTWQIENPTRTAILANGGKTHTKDSTWITNMTLPNGQVVAQYTTTFSITNKNVNNPACGLKDTVVIYLIKPGAAASPGKLQTSDSVCYGTTGKQIELRDPVGAIRLDWQTRKHTTPANNAWTTFITNTTTLFYNVPEIITEDDYRVLVTFSIPGAAGNDIGTCPTTTTPAFSDILTIRLKNKDKFRLGRIDPTTLEVCAESPIHLETTYKDSASELNGHNIKKWQTYQINAYDKINRNKVPAGNPWTDQNVTSFDYNQTAPARSATIFYRAWVKDVDPNGCDFVTDTAVVYIQPKPKMSGSLFPICADNMFNFKFDSTTEGGYSNSLYPTNQFTTAIKQITWQLTNISSHNNTGMKQENGILSGFKQTISYKGINNDTLPLIDTVQAFATGNMSLGCKSDIKIIRFKVYPKARAELTNDLPLVNCPPIYINNFLKLREYKSLNSGYSWNVNDMSTGVWTTNGVTAPNIPTNYAQNLAIQLTALSLYKDSATGTPCPSAILKDTLFSFGKISPNITISDSVCYGLPISFINNTTVNTPNRLQDTLTYKWWDKNGGLISTDIIPKTPFIPTNIYPYTDSIYTIRYDITNTCYTISEYKDVHIQSIPKADLKVNIDSFCSGTTIKIWKDNELGNNPNSYKNEWIFGDGKPSFSTSIYHDVVDSLRPISHKYDSISYAVDTLMQIVSNNCGKDTKIHLIKILPVPRPNINLTFKDTICGSENKYAVLDKTFFGGKEPVSASWFVNDLLVDKKDTLYAVGDTLSSDTLWHSFAQYVNKEYPDQVKPISIKLLVTPTLGCAADSTSYILVGSTAQPALFIDTIQPCSPASFNARVTTAAGINQYTWILDTAHLNINSSFLPNIPWNSGRHKIKVIVSSKRKVCPIDSADATVIVYGYPQSQFELLNPEPYCYTPFPAHYKSIAIDADAKMMPITNWYWKIDSSKASLSYPKNIEENDFIYTYPLGGIYTTKHWVSDTRGTFRCISDTITRNYEIFGRSFSNFTMVDTTCATYTVSFTNKSTLGYGSSLIDSSYWIMGDGSAMQKFKEATSTNNAYKQGGEYNISLLTKGNKACRFDTLTKKLIVRGFPKANFDIISPCSGNYTFFYNISTPGFADDIKGYLWTFEDGQNSNIKNPSKLYDISGTYNAKLTANGFFCPLKSDTTISFLINDAPKPMRYPILYVGENVPFDLIAPSDNNSYLWLDKNKFPVNLQDPKAQIVTSVLPTQITDTFYLRSTLGNCIVDNVQIVQALPKLDVLAPTGFTPNGDGVNDLFLPKYVGVKILNHFQIFDRFGQLLFSTNDLKQSWDGTFRGKPLPTATYIWVVSAINDRGESVNASGGITLIRDDGLK